ncbi:hypothetical protein [Niabella aurantiaca]|uniref:hypothetical protein n=1 Tax=Niabella aurantiaca TaxID=379900 RepID=UPI0003718C1F|nr:hypothetical protein [Niabella aurantiaca]
MKKIVRGISGMLFMVSLFSACTKDKPCDPEDEESPCYAGIMNRQYFNMKIDGVEWNATNVPGHLFFVESPNPEVDGDTGAPFFRVELVGLTGTKPNGVTIELQLPQDRFSNPKGTYPVIADPRKLQKAGGSSVWVYAINGTEAEYGSLFPESIVEDVPLMPDVGTVTITDFELGDTKENSNRKRLYRIKGTFSASTIYGYDVPDGFNGDTKSIAEGEFNLVNALSLK